MIGLPRPVRRGPAGDETFAKLGFYVAHSVEEVLIADPQARSVRIFRCAAGRPDRLPSRLALTPTRDAHRLRAVRDRDRHRRRVRAPKDHLAVVSGGGNRSAVLRSAIKIMGRYE